jgi:hypothetical protein
VPLRPCALLQDTRIRPSTPAAALHPLCVCEAAVGNSIGLAFAPWCLKARRAQVNPWTDEERTIFMEKLADFAGRPEREGLRKNFYRLSHFLPNKSTRDCIHFYYAQKKTQV